MAFSDSVDGQFVLFTTTNGGRTWDRMPAERLPPALPNEGAYAASGTNVAVAGSHVWIGTTASRVLHSRRPRQDLDGRADAGRDQRFRRNFFDRIP